MIDTIVMRVHRINNYRHIVNYLKQINTKDYVKKFHHKGLHDLQESAILFGDTGRVLSLTHRSSIGLASSHYSITFQINEERDFIEFNFSLPKLLYTTNVMQFIDKDSMTQSNCYEKFLKAIQSFFHNYFPLPPNWKDVEVHRIDICYNQFFLTKQDALNYLNAQKNLSIEFARSEANKLDTYGDSQRATTVMQKTDTYSFKIYHKGTEFRKHDLTSLCKKNPMNFDLDMLSNAADKILRYELTCRNGLMNYLIKQRIIKNDSTVLNHHFQKIGKSRTTMMQKFIRDTFPNKRFKYNLESDWDYLHQTPTNLINNNELGFTRELFDEIVDFFWKKVNAFQMGLKLSLTDITLKIQELQKKKKSLNSIFTEKEHVHDTGNLLLIAALSQHQDISDLRKFLPKSTYYRYMNKLKELNIPKHTSDMNFLPPDLGYTNYLFYFEKYHILGFQNKANNLIASNNFD